MQAMQSMKQTDSLLLQKLLFIIINIIDNGLSITENACFVKMIPLSQNNINGLYNVFYFLDVRGLGEQVMRSVQTKPLHSNFKQNAL